MFIDFSKAFNVCDTCVIQVPTLFCPYLVIPNNRRVGFWDHTFLIFNTETFNDIVICPALWLCFCVGGALIIKNWTIDNVIVKFDTFLINSINKGGCLTTKVLLVTILLLFDRPRSFVLYLSLSDPLFLSCQDQNDKNTK